MSSEKTVQKIREFCLSSARDLTINGQHNTTHLTFVKRAFGPDVDILYYEQLIDINRFRYDLNYCGFFSKVTGKVYDLEFFTCDQACRGRHDTECYECSSFITSSDADCERLGQLETEIEERLSEKLRDVYKHTEAFLPYLGGKYPDVPRLNELAEEKARQAFLHNRSLDGGIRYPMRPAFSDVIEYLHHKDVGINRIFENYMKENPYQLYSEAAVNMLADVRVKEMTEQKDLSLLCLRALTLLNDSFYTQEAKNKTCDVTIEKDGKEFTFKRRGANIFEYDFHKLLSRSQQEYIWCFGSPDNKYSYMDIKRIVRQGIDVYNKEAYIAQMPSK